MEITRTAHADAVELKLNGRLDATWSDHVGRALAECVRAGQHHISVDMAAVDYISSAGLRILVLYARQLSNIQGRLGVNNPSAMVRKVLELAGLDELLLPGAASARAATPAAKGSASSVALPEPGATAEVFDLDSDATLRVHWPGNADAWFEGRTSTEACSLVQFPANVIGIGLGALVSGEACLTQAFGEFVAAAGIAVCQPADGANQPDYLLSQGALQPAMRVAYGMLGLGGFRRLLRFDKGPQQPSLPLSAVVKTGLEISGSEAAGLVLVAETASLIGASLQKAPAAHPATGRAEDVFSFPQVRDWLGFTAEPAFANSSCLMVGFAARRSRAPDLRLLRPMLPSGELYGHFHAAALPYQPLRKGKVGLAETLQRLFETERVLGVLHLLNDWRELTGAGESRLLRGACWCAPVTM